MSFSAHTRTVAASKIQPTAVSRTVDFHRLSLCHARCLVFPTIFPNRRIARLAFAGGLASDRPRFRTRDERVGVSKPWIFIVKEEAAARALTVAAVDIARKSWPSARRSARAARLLRLKGIGGSSVCSAWVEGPASSPQSDTFVLTSTPSAGASGLPWLSEPVALRSESLGGRGIC